MELLTNPYALSLIFSSFIVGCLSIYIGLKIEDSVKWIVFAMLAFAIWGFFYGLELTSQTVENMLFWSKFQYFGLVLAPSCWVIFALKYTGYNTSKNSWIYPALFILPAITLIIVLTNEWHHLHYKRTWLLTEGPFPLLGIEKGVWYPVQIAYSYAFYFLGTSILWRRFRYANIHFKLQTRLLIIAGFFPLAVNVLYQFSLIKPYEGLDLTPYAFIFSYLFISIAILKFNLLNLKPVARDKILDVMTRGILVFDQQEKIVDFNASSKAFFPELDKIRIGQIAGNIFSQNPEIQKIIQEKENQIIESHIKNGAEEKVLRVESYQISDQRTMTMGTLLFFDDITHQIKTNEQLKQQAIDLQQLNELKDKFFSIISHDLKGPVFGVKELIHLTQKGVITKEEFMEMLPEVSRNMEHVALLLENLLAWTSSQLRGEYLQPQVLDLNKLIISQKNLLDRIAQEKSISIQVPDFDDTSVLADKNMMELIIRNLMSNAIKFSSAGSEVLVTCEKKENQIKLCVQDFGIGIPEENLKKLNEGISFTTRGEANESGTGLGLLLVREYILKNEGNMTVQSKVGEGSKFCITFPRAYNLELINQN